MHDLLNSYYGITVLGLTNLTSGKMEDLVFSIIIIFVLMPIIVGRLLTFGVYALWREYVDKQ